MALPPILQETEDATAAATAGKLMRRDANGRAQVAAPSAGNDITNKTYVDGLLGGGYAPMPSTTAGAAGQVASIVVGSGGSYTLPAGGTWFCYATRLHQNGGLYTGVATVAPGGTTVCSGENSQQWHGFAWRLA